MDERTATDRTRAWGVPCPMSVETSQQAVAPAVETLIDLDSLEAALSGPQPKELPGTPRARSTPRMRPLASVRQGTGKSVSFDDEQVVESPAKGATRQSAIMDRVILNRAANNTRPLLPSGVSDQAGSKYMEEASDAGTSPSVTKLKSSIFRPPSDTNFHTAQSFRSKYRSPSSDLAPDLAISSSARLHEVTRKASSESESLE